KYLMDQAEAFAGLRAGAELAQSAGMPTLAMRAACDAARMRAAVHALWDATIASFDWAVHADGARQRTAWRNLYPDALEQVWAVAFGLARSQGPAIMDRLERFEPRWDTPGAAVRSGGAHAPNGYWPLGAWAYARTG